MKIVHFNVMLNCNKVKQIMKSTRCYRYNEIDMIK